MPDPQSISPSPPITRLVPPTVTFDVVDGWLTIHVTENGQPMPNVSVRCLIGAQVWASGETDAEGRGMFPRPQGDWCQVVFDLGAGPSAPVPLTFLRDGHVVPLSAPILDGTAECCDVLISMPRLPSPPIVTDRTDAYFVAFLIGTIILTIAAALVLVRMYRRSRARPIASRRTARHLKRKSHS